jgi:hypothetical protein
MSKTLIAITACMVAVGGVTGCTARAGVRATTTTRRPPPPPPPGPAFDATGWELLGERVVDGRSDSDVIQVGRDDGRFTKLMLVVEDSDLEMIDMQITFGNNTTLSPQVRQFFRENTRTRAIDLPGEKRVIKRINFRYANLPGGGKARVAVYGKPFDGPVAEPTPQPVLKANWDATGWVLLGEKVVDGKVDRDVIPVGHKEGKFTRVMVVVEDSDLEMHDMEITFGNGKKFKPAVKHFFREADRTRSIDLPKNARVIKNISFVYGNLPGGGKARVAVYAK